MAAVNPNVVPWQAVGVREALRDAAALWRDSVPARWPATRRKAVADFARAAELLQPCALAVRSFLPPTALALAPNFVADKLLSVDAAAPSGFSLRRDWLLVDFGSRWADVRLDSVSAWARFNTFLTELISFAGAPGVPPMALPGGAPHADVVAQLATLTDALAQQQRQHTEAMAVLQAQLAAQEARATAAAEKAAADAAHLLAGRQAANVFQAELSLLAASPMVMEAWTLPELDVLTEVLVFHGTKLSSKILASGSTRFGADPTENLRPASFPLLKHLCPRLAAENPVLLTGDLLTVEWAAAFVFCLKRRLIEWQSFVVMVDPHFHEVDFEALGSAGRQTRAHGAVALIPQVPPATQPVAPVTPEKSELFRQADADVEAAVKGDPVSGDAPAFSGSSLLTRLSPVVVTKGILSGLDLCVRPDSRFAEDESPTWSLQPDGSSKLKIDSKCKTLDEWESSFLKLALQARSPAAGSTLLEFRSWFRLRALQFGFKILQEFYCQLIKQVAAGTASMEQGQWNLLWAEFQLVKFREGTDLFVPASSRAVVEPPNKKPKSAVPTKPSPSAKKKHCFAFNRAGGCKRQGCTHPHVCSKCGKGHSVLACAEK